MDYNSTLSKNQMILQYPQESWGKLSDGYHTFDELYHYRALYNAAFFNLLPSNWVSKSKKHFTGEPCFNGDYFIVTALLPTGQISNHYPMKYWDIFRIPEYETSPVEWDGHTPEQASERLEAYLHTSHLKG